MKLDLLYWLFILSIVSGAITLIDRLYWRNTRATRPFIVTQAIHYFPIIFVVFCVRSFLFQHFYVPTNSLAPSVLAGDYLLVNEFSYGLRLSVIHRPLIPLGSVQRGDIIVFHWPVNPDVMMVKRVVGLPGDRISYINKKLTVNGKAYPLKLIANAEQLEQYLEKIGSTSHKIYLNPLVKADNFRNFIVPKQRYFVMGDNRDDSEDSRHWGLVDDKLIIGKAVKILASWDTQARQFRRNRVWQTLS